MRQRHRLSITSDFVQLVTFLQHRRALARAEHLEIEQSIVVDFRNYLATKLGGNEVIRDLDPVTVPVLHVISTPARPLACTKPPRKPAVETACYDQYQ